MSRHRFDPFSFIAGAVALGIALAVLAGQVTIRVVDLRLAGPVLVLALGVALLLAGGRDRPDEGAVAVGHRDTGDGTVDVGASDDGTSGHDAAEGGATAEPSTAPVEDDRGR